MSKPTDVLLDLSFEAAFTEMQAVAAEINRENKFTEPDDRINKLEEFLQMHAPCIMASDFPGFFEDMRRARAGLKLALITSEISESLDAVRKNLGTDDHIPDFTAEEAECADAVIRLMNYATDRKLRLAEAITAKIQFNRDRADHTDRSGPHGKAF